MKGLLCSLKMVAWENIKNLLTVYKGKYGFLLHRTKDYLWANASLSRSFSYFSWASTEPNGSGWECDPAGKVALLPGPPIPPIPPNPLIPPIPPIPPKPPIPMALPPLLPPGPAFITLLEPREFLSIFWCFGLSAGGCNKQTSNLSNEKWKIERKREEKDWA